MAWYWGFYGDQVRMGIEVSFVWFLEKIDVFDPSF